MATFRQCAGYPTVLTLMAGTFTPGIAGAAGPFELAGLVEVFEVLEVFEVFGASEAERPAAGTSAGALGTQALATTSPIPLAKPKSCGAKGVTLRRMVG
jgi:hypothetical protein